MKEISIKRIPLKKLPVPNAVWRINAYTLTRVEDKKDYKVLTLTTPEFPDYTFKIYFDRMTFSEFHWIAIPLYDGMDLELWELLKDSESLYKLQKGE